MIVERDRGFVVSAKVVLLMAGILGVGAVGSGFYAAISKEAEAKEREIQAEFARMPDLAYEHSVGIFRARQLLPDQVQLRGPGATSWATDPGIDLGGLGEHISLRYLDEACGIASDLPSATRGQRFELLTVRTRLRDCLTEKFPIPNR